MHSIQHMATPLFFASLALAAPSLAPNAPSVPMITVEIAPKVYMPLVGIGTWQYNDTITEAAVGLALELGYPHIDTAWDYHNSVGIGRALRRSSRWRESIFITTKVEGGLNASRTRDEVMDNLRDLGVSYVDLILIHFPAPIGPHG